MDFKGEVVAIEVRKEIYDYEEMNKLKIISKERKIDKINDDLYMVTIHKAKVKQQLYGQIKRTVVDVPIDLYNTKLIGKTVNVEILKENGKYIYTIKEVIE